jgi:hypothetical protein
MGCGAGGGGVLQQDGDLLSEPVTRSLVVVLVVLLVMLSPLLASLLGEAVLAPVTPLGGPLLHAAHRMGGLGLVHPDDGSQRVREGKSRQKRKETAPAGGAGECCRQAVKLARSRPGSPRLLC